MEEDVKTLRDYLDIVWRRKYWIVIPAAILMIGATLFTYSLPATYRSEGLILIESQEIPPDLIRTTVTSYADQRIEVIKQRLLTTNRIMEYVNKHNLYADERSKTPATAPIVALFRDNVAVEIVQANVTDPTSGRATRASIAFRVAFMDKSPQTAQRVANDLVTEFLSENVRTRTDRAQDTAEFLRVEGDRLQREVQEIERNIAEFRDQYSDSLPDLLEYNLSMIKTIQDDIAAAENQIMTLNDQAATMSMQLSMMPAMPNAGAGQGNNVNLPPEVVRLETLRSELRSMQSRYAESHPDLQRVKREIAALEADIGISETPRQALQSQFDETNSRLQSLKQRYAAEHPDLKATEAELARIEQRLAELPTESAEAASSATQTYNPMTVNIQSRIDSAQREISRLRQRQVEQRERLQEFERRIVQTNQVQRAYRDLTRDHENRLTKYREIRAKQLEAELSQTLESENKGESFTLIEPPQVPNTSEKPNREKLLAMGFIASVGSGLGLAIMIEMIFGGVRGYNQVTHVVGKAPLVVIPKIVTASQSRRKKRLIILLVLLMIIGIVASMFLIHTFVTNLEVFWFKLINKINLL